MALASLRRMGNEFPRLLWDQGFSGAVDLKLRYREVQGWFSGGHLYREVRTSVYPPASYVILWPFLGWLELASARWLWAATAAVALGGLAYLLVRESRADPLLERVFVALLPFPLYATNVAIGNGQLIVHLLPVLVAGYALLAHRRQGWREDLFAGILVLLTLVSPTIAAPFFWIALFVPATLRPALIVMLGYIALTLFAVSFQEADPVSLFNSWHWRAVGGAAFGAARGGYANLQSWLLVLGVGRTWRLSASLLTLAALGVWTYRHRREDLWLLLGVTAIVARMWTYHRLYDDLLMLLPMITLFRIAKQAPSAERDGVIAGVLLAINYVAMFSLSRLLEAPAPWGLLLRTEHTIIWIATLIFLLDQARRKKTQGLAGETSVSTSP